ncbi:MAG: DUF1588 domain-containing protein [Planctomycetota bacterium]
MRMFLTALMTTICSSASVSLWANGAAGLWQSSGFPLLETYCLDCHNGDFREADVDLSPLQTRDGIAANPDLAMHAINMIRFGAMPPEDADVPNDQDRRLLADSLDELVYQTTCDLRPQPGKITARRLNRAEYNHAIRDLFGIDLRPADRFPSDEVGGGFDNNADVLSVSTMLMDKYLDAAESVASAIVVDPEELPTINSTSAGVDLNILGEFRVGRFGEHYVAPDSALFVDVNVPVEGSYQFDFRGSPSTPSQSDPENLRVAKEDNDDADTVTAILDSSGLLIAIAKTRFRGPSGRMDSATFRLRLDEGQHRLFVCPTTRQAKSVDRERDERWRVGESVWKDKTRWSTQQMLAAVRDANENIRPHFNIQYENYPFKIHSFRVSGPSPRDRGDLPPTQREILRSEPRYRSEALREKDFVNIESSARQCLRPIARRAFRGPVSDDQLQPYVDLVLESIRRDESFIEGLQSAITGILVSPRFLFRIELPDESQIRAAKADVGETADPSDHLAVPLSSGQLASRLSFFLWSSLPDDALLSAADRDTLRDPKRRREQVRRMLGDSKSRSLAEQFATQWFGLGGLSSRETVVDSESLLGETRALFNHVLTTNLPVGDLLTANYSFVDADLAEHYELAFPGDADQRFAKVSLSGTGRRGLLSHASVLTLTSYPDRNSPVLRGKWILENVLGTPPPDAPAGVPGLEATQELAPDATLREQLEQHRADPGCASCHRVMDALGFGLEQFDHLGQRRDEDGSVAFDAAGELPGGRRFSGAMELSDVLAKTETRRFAETATRRLLTFAIGRELRPADRCFVEAILDRCADDDFRLRDLIEAVIDSPPFTHFSVPFNEGSVRDAEFISSHD